ncbi:MAG TPA: hypothetical protein V6C84_12555 [Coleofasciculaceae cyanobacterium]|jgi:hypothetical protein
MNIDIKRSGSQPSAKGSNEYFTGIVRVDWLEQVSDQQYEGMP